MAMVRKQLIGAFLPLAVLAFLLCFAAPTIAHVASSGEEISDFSVISLPSIQNVEQNNGGGDTWCIAKPSTDETLLINNIRYSCGQTGVDCSTISGPNGACYYPNNVFSHASMAMNLYYKAAGKHPWNCYFSGSGLIVTTNPSTGKCIYI